MKAKRCFHSKLGGVGALLAFSALAGASPAWAEPAKSAEQMAAKALYEQALLEMKEQKFAPACEKLEEVVRLVPRGVGAKLTLADCYLGAGRLASAWSTFRLAAEAARQEKQLERSDLARQEAETLQPRLSGIHLRIGPALQKIGGLSLKLDGAVVPLEGMNANIPVDQGLHWLRVEAPGYLPWSRKVDIPRDGVQFHIAVAELKAEHAMPSPLLSGRADEKTSPVGINGSLATIYTGAFTLAGSAAAGIVAISQYSYCSKNTCDNTTQSLTEAKSQTATNLSTAMAITGGLILGAGLTWYAAAQNDSDAPRASISVGAGNASLLVRW